MKNILIAVTGLTPQIVSETLYCLSVQKKIKVDEIYIVTTTEGKKNLDKYHFIDRKTGEKKGPFSLKKEIAEMCRVYKINEPGFGRKNIIVAGEENLKIPDVRTDRENILFPNVITKFIAEKSSNPDNVLYCSLSGGRKTMSAYMGFALSVFARENDKLYHVLASESMENSCKFFPKDMKTDKLILSEVPFLRLRPILSKSIDIEHKSYSSLIDFCQEQLRKMTVDLMFIEKSRRLLTINGKSFPMESSLLAVYLYLIQQKEKGIEETEIIEFETRETAAEIFKIYCEITSKSREYYESRITAEQLKNMWWKNGFKNIRPKISKINDVIYDNIDGRLAEEFVVSTTRIYGKSKYYIYAPLSRFIVK